MLDSTLAKLVPLIFTVLSLASCASGNAGGAEDSQSIISNPVSYFEIPVMDMDRATSFYETVLGVSLERTVIHGSDMALFPFDENSRGISGALAKGDSYVPSKSGPRVYFFVESIGETLERAISNGGRVAFPKTQAGDFWVAEVEDSEGNLIALSSADE